MRPVLPAMLAAAFVAGCGGHGETPTASRPTPTSSSIHVRLTAQSHRPRVGKHWSYEVRVTDAAGKPVPATLHLQILFGGVPVGQVGRHRVANGIWRETLGAPGNPPFPARARGQPLVFQAVVTAKGQTKKANWWIRVR
ncbi:MAG TPA: hypothetical protein VGJ27_04630 [Gaiellaceae bacterium]